MTDARFSDLACIVVHHKHFPGILETVQQLLEQGLTEQSLLVVDNSESVDLRAELLEALPYGVKILFTENRGYAAAVNSGLSHLAATQGLQDFTLIATHEVRPGEGSVEHLMDAARSDSAISAAGPTLIDLEANRVWSTGGSLTRILRVPIHARDELPSDSTVVDRDWLDGAFVVYRTRDIFPVGLPEQYFLYFEETHLHQALRRTGRRVVAVPAARVGQSSNGVPPYLYGRNLAIFLSNHGRPGLRGAGSLWVGARTLAREAFGRVPRGSGAAYIKGWRDRHRRASI